MREGAASFARRRPPGLAHRLVDAATPLEGMSPGTIVEVGAEVPPARWFDVADAALAAGAWAALPARDLGALAARFGVAMPGGPALVLAPRRPASLPARRAADVVLASLMLIAASPILVLCALGVKLTTAGPVFFRARVVGRGGRTFEWLKFRTMRPIDAGDDARRQADFAAFARGGRQGAGDYKVVDESRVTAFGGFLRRHSLDELPQLLNVLRGDLALVGPRPCLEYERAHYDGWRARRFETDPGVTGLWQVYGRSRVPFESAVIMDIVYAYVRSVPFDLGLIARTALVMLRGQGGR